MSSRNPTGNMAETVTSDPIDEIFHMDYAESEWSCSTRVQEKFQRCIGHGCGSRPLPRTPPIRGVRLDTQIWFRPRCMPCPNRSAGGPRGNASAVKGRACVVQKWNFFLSPAPTLTHTRIASCFQCRLRTTQGPQCFFNPVPHCESPCLSVS